jgi:serum/glucocorticoid-regulated kinase 2
LPIDPSALPQPTKRKSVILNTLSRLASPASKSTGLRNSVSQFFATSPSSPIPSTLPTPIVCPKAEVADPFFDDLGAVAVGASNSVNPTTTGLAAYLTTLSNDQVFRQARPWKRFVRVRTDDLESIRVERAIQRVRSDAAAHITSPRTVNVTVHNSGVLHDVKRTGTDHESREAETHRQDDSLTQDTEPFPSLDNSEGAPSQVLDDTASTSASARSVVEIEASYNGSIVQPTSPSPPPPLERSRTPISSDQRDDCPMQDTNRTPSHASSCYVRRPWLHDSTSTSASTNSVMFPDSGSIARPILPSPSPIFPSFAARKVQVSDFEMIRVLGKGRAGKVLLVRHKSSSFLYALKAITKRHVLAHQEIRLTEQAVLRRMAAESADPFIVKLWWSFHDEENLFLVMVRLACIHIQCSVCFVLTHHRDRTSTPAAILGHS